jgi:hypothetical protein
MGFVEGLPRYGGWMAIWSTTRQEDGSQSQVAPRTAIRTLRFTKSVAVPSGVWSKYSGTRGEDMRLTAQIKKAVDGQLDLHVVELPSLEAHARKFEDIAWATSNSTF